MKVNLTYFKISGKYYATGEFETKAEWMYQIFEEVRTLKLNKKLPGLISGSGDSYIIHVCCPGHPNEYPGLIL